MVFCVPSASFCTQTVELYNLKQCVAVLCLSSTLHRRMERCSAMHCPSVHWMHTTGELHFPFSSASTKHSLTLAGTKVTLKAVTVEMFLLLQASRRQSSSQQLGTSLTHFKITYYKFFFTKLHRTSCCKIKQFYEFVFHR